MIKVDLHCHTKFSDHPSEWFLQRIGTRESYTEVKDLYQQAKSRGATHVTITDHNTIDGALKLVNAYPADTFISVEATSYFPETGCKVHILIFDITPEQFEVVEELRSDVYDLRNYLRDEDIACSVAHATYSVNGKLTAEILEQLILLFDVFEGINGSRGEFHNQILRDILDGLTPEDILRMQKKHGIDPWGKKPWIKGVTAGSDDHAGLFVCRAYTESSCDDIKIFMRNLREKNTQIGGSIGGHKSLAFAIYKIAYKFSHDKALKAGDGMMDMLSSLLFEDGKTGFREKWALKKLQKSKDSKSRALGRFISEISTCNWHDSDVQKQVDGVYASLGRLTDEFFVMMVRSLDKDLRSKNSSKIFRNMSAVIPAIFMITPFFSTMHHLNCRNRGMLSDFYASIGTKRKKSRKRILWFSDTIVDLNGVAVTMRSLATTAYETNRPMKLVTSLPESEADNLPENTINLPCIYSATPDFYSAYTLRLPSVLTAIDLIAKAEPDEIVISTPGPVGLLGLTAARALGLKCTGIYHTDFTKQADMFIGDEMMSSLIEGYSRWFFRKMDAVKVPSDHYIEMLSERGIERERMSLFRRGVEASFSKENLPMQNELRKQLGISDDDNVLMWAGRLGKEKNLDFMIDICSEAIKLRENTKLLIVGDGPEYEVLQKRVSVDNIIFTGRVDRKVLSQLYHISDVFVFPSTTDTFGMVVLEGQACGLPAIVTDVGGPQEIVFDGETGMVVPAGARDAWVDAIVSLIDLKNNSPVLFENMRSKSKLRNHEKYSWEAVLDEMMGMNPDGGESGSVDLKQSCCTKSTAA